MTSCSNFGTQRATRTEHIDFSFFRSNGRCAQAQPAFVCQKQASPCRQAQGNIRIPDATVAARKREAQTAGPGAAKGPDLVYQIHKTEKRRQVDRAEQLVDQAGGGGDGGNPGQAQHEDDGKKARTGAEEAAEGRSTGSARSRAPLGCGVWQSGRWPLRSLPPRRSRRCHRRKGRMKRLFPRRQRRSVVKRDASESRPYGSRR